MATVIYKYGPLLLPGTVHEVLGKPIKLDGQGTPKQMFCWCLVELYNDGTHIPHQNRKVRIVATGQPYTGSYIDSYVEDNGLVWHLVTAD